MTRRPATPPPKQSRTYWYGLPSPETPTFHTDHCPLAPEPVEADVVYANNGVAASQSLRGGTSYEVTNVEALVVSPADDVSLTAVAESSRPEESVALNDTGSESESLPDLKSTTSASLRRSTRVRRQPEPKSMFSLPIISLK